MNQRQRRRSEEDTRIFDEFSFLGGKIAIESMVVVMMAKKRRSELASSCLLQ